MSSRSTPGSERCCTAAWNRLARFVRVELLRGRRIRPEDAADLTQEVLLALLPKIQRGETPDDLRGLAVVVARRTRTRWLRRRQRERLWREWFAETLVAPVESGFDPDLREGLRLMADDARAAFLAVYVDGLPLRAAAQNLGLTVHHVRRLSAEGRGFLRRLWGIREGDSSAPRARRKSSRQSSGEPASAPATGPGFPDPAAILEELMRPPFPPEFEPDPLDEAHWLEDGGRDLAEEPDEPRPGPELGQPAPVPKAV